MQTKCNPPLKQCQKLLTIGLDSQKDSENLLQNIIKNIHIYTHKQNDKSTNNKILQSTMRKFKI